MSESRELSMCRCGFKITCFNTNLSGGICVCVWCLGHIALAQHSLCVFLWCCCGIMWWTCLSAAHANMLTVWKLLKESALKESATLTNESFNETCFHFRIMRIQNPRVQKVTPLKAYKCPWWRKCTVINCQTRTGSLNQSNLSFYCLPCTLFWWTQIDNCQWGLFSVMFCRSSGAAVLSVQSINVMQCLEIHSWK